MKAAFLTGIRTILRCASHDGVRMNDAATADASGSQHRGLRQQNAAAAQFDVLADIG